MEVVLPATDPHDDVKEELQCPNVEENLLGGSSMCNVEHIDDGGEGGAAMVDEEWREQTSKAKGDGENIRNGNLSDPKYNKFSS
jgi:hypothetical protein